MNIKNIYKIYMSQSREKSPKSFSNKKFKTKIDRYCSKLDGDMDKNPNLIGRFIIDINDIKTKSGSLSPKISKKKMEQETSETPMKKSRKVGKGRKLSYGGGKKKGKDKGKVKSVTVPLGAFLETESVGEEAGASATPRVRIESIRNNGKLMDGRSITNRSVSHSELFEHIFRNMLRGGDQMYILGEMLQTECQKQYSGVELKVKTILQSNLCVYEFYINKIPGKKAPQIPRFHLSIHGMGGRNGKLGLVHVVRDDIERRNSNFMKWKNTVLLGLKIRRTQDEVSLLVDTSHSPSGARSVNGRNSLVRRRHGERGAPTLVMQYGVTISRVFQEFLDSMKPIRVEKLNS